MRLLIWVGREFPMSESVVIQDLDARETKINEATQMLTSSLAKEAFAQLTHEFPEFVVISHCGTYCKPSASLVDWKENITITIEDAGEWVRK